MSRGVFQGEKEKFSRKKFFGEPEVLFSSTKNSIFSPRNSMKNLKPAYERARQTELETRKNFLGPMKKFLEILVNLENYDVITRD